MAGCVDDAGFGVLAADVLERLRRAGTARPSDAEMEAMSKQTTDLLGQTAFSDLALRAFTDEEGPAAGIELLETIVRSVRSHGVVGWLFRMVWAAHTSLIEADDRQWSQSEQEVTALFSYLDSLNAMAAWVLLRWARDTRRAAAWATLLLAGQYPDALDAMRAEADIATGPADADDAGTGDGTADGDIAGSDGVAGTGDGDGTGVGERAGERDRNHDGDGACGGDGNGDGDGDGDRDRDRDRDDARDAADGGSACRLPVPDRGVRGPDGVAWRGAAGYAAASRYIEEEYHARMQRVQASDAHDGGEPWPGRSHVDRCAVQVLGLRMALLVQQSYDDGDDAAFARCMTVLRECRSCVEQHGLDALPVLMMSAVQPVPDDKRSEDDRIDDARRMGADTAVVMLSWVDDADHAAALASALLDLDMVRYMQIAQW